MNIEAVASPEAAALVVEHHYLHRRPPISYAYGLRVDGATLGVVTFGTPASRHLQKSACPSDPSLTIELNRLWVSGELPRNTESWFVSRALKALPPRIVVSYADTTQGHLGYIYRALNFRYAGWTDMERKTPRFDYIPLDPAAHTREAFRSGYSERRRRLPKVKYWTVTGDKRERRDLARLCGWPSLDWKLLPPPGLHDSGSSCRVVDMNTTTATGTVGTGIQTHYVRTIAGVPTTYCGKTGDIKSTTFPVSCRRCMKVA